MTKLEKWMSRAKELVDLDRIPTVRSNSLRIVVGLEKAVHDSQLQQFELEILHGDSLAAKYLALTYIHALSLKCSHVEDSGEDEMGEELSEEEIEDIQSLKSWCREQFEKFAESGPSIRTTESSRILWWELDCAFLGRLPLRVRDVLDQLELFCFCTPENRKIIEGVLLILMENPPLAYCPFDDYWLLNARPSTFWLANSLQAYLEKLPLQVNDSPLLVRGTEVLRQGLRASDNEDSAYRCLLGLAEFELGNSSQAAVEWEKVLQSPGRVSLPESMRMLVKDAETMESGIPFDWNLPLLRSISVAWERAEKTERAIKYLDQAIKAGLKAGDYCRMSSLHLKSGANYMEAYRYLLLELESQSTASPSPEIDILLAVAGGAGLPAFEDYCRRISQLEPSQRAQEIIRRTLRASWPEFIKLTKVSADCFVEAVYFGEILEEFGERTKAEWSILKYATAVEHELHAVVFQPFKQKMNDADRAAAGRLRDESLEPFKEFLLDVWPMSIGQAIRALQLEPSDSLTKKFRAVLDSGFSKSIRDKRYRGIGEFRLMAAHPLDLDGTPKAVNLASAHEMMLLCKSFLTDLHTQPSVSHGGPSMPGSPVPRVNR